MWCNNLKLADGVDAAGKWAGQKRTYDSGREGQVNSSSVAAL